MGEIRRGSDVIVGLTGTGPPFPRLLEGLAAYARLHPQQEIWVQHGTSKLLPPLTGEELVPRTLLLERMRRADVVVSHAGCGSISDAFRCAHVPVIMPRRAKYDEHVNDHQLELVEALSSEGRIIAVHDIADLDDAIAQATEARPHQVATEPGAELKRALAAEVVQWGSTGPKWRTTLAWRLMEAGTRLLIR